MATQRHRPRGNPLWYKDAIFYEVRVRSFCDSDGDGVGDFRGLADKLDYLRDLGVNTLWLLPFYPSPLRDDGYDIADYTTIDPECGTIEDFKLFLGQAHRRNLRVLTELVINHTSDQHPWFQRARRSPAGSRWRNFYVWSDSPERYTEARIIFKDFEPSNWTWDPLAKAYYWHRFFSHQPDLNFESQDVRKAVFQAMQFWFDMGVDGMRLDAIPYLFERDGTNCENLPETHAFLKDLRRRLDQKYRNRMFLAEANQWPEDAVPYFGQGDECHMAFHFPVMPRLFMALHMEDRYPIEDILAQTPEIPDTCQWALFLRNHDELTLEMVTDEERDYMYRVYAYDAQARINLGIRRRLAPLLGNDRRRIELMNALLFSLPGAPFLYYGDEIGMGDNIYLGDRNGVRTPMQWSGDRNAGFSRANPQKLYLPVVVDPEYHYESVNVETQQNNPRSLLWWMKRLIALRKRFKAFSRGTLEFLHPSNRKVLAFIRRYEDEQILVVANLSRFVQYVELDLSAYRGAVAVELFGRNAFPPIGDLPYFLTFGPHSFYWFSLEPHHPQAQVVTARAPTDLPTLRVKESWSNVLQADYRERLESSLPSYLGQCRWFGGKALATKNAQFTDVVPASPEACVTLLRVDYAEGNSETYALPLAFQSGRRAAELREHAAGTILANLEVRNDSLVQGVLYDALHSPRFSSLLLDLIAEQRSLQGTGGRIVASATRAFRKLRGAAGEDLRPAVLGTEQSNSSVAFGERFILKLFRRPTDGINPDLEIGRFLTERARFPHTPPVAGALEYRVGRHEPSTLGILHGFVPNEGDAWRFTLDEVRRYYERALSRHADIGDPPAEQRSLLTLIDVEAAPLAGELLGSYLESARLLGRRTAELHRALASATDDPAFTPEPFTTLYQRSLYQSMRNLTTRTFLLLRERLGSLSGGAREHVESLLPQEDRLLQTFHAIVGHKVNAMRIRVHGDYHLGQVLYTGRDFVIIDFEGEPARPLAERRLKRSPLRDVAGMLRSFDYAAQSVLRESESGGLIRPEDVPRMAPWAIFWTQWASSSFLRSYLRHTAKAPFLPRSRQELALLLRLFLLEKNVYEIAYELNNRPGWVEIPASGILRLLASDL